MRWSETSGGDVEDEDENADADIRDDDDVDSANICVARDIEPVNHKTKQ